VILLVYLRAFASLGQRPKATPAVAAIMAGASLMPSLKNKVTAPSLSQVTVVDLLRMP